MPRAGPTATVGAATVALLLVAICLPGWVMAGSKAGGAFNPLQCAVPQEYRVLPPGFGIKVDFLGAITKNERAVLWTKDGLKEDASLVSCFDYPADLDMAPYSSRLLVHALDNSDPEFLIPISATLDLQRDSLYVEPAFGMNKEQLVDGAVRMDSVAASVTRPREALKSALQAWQSNMWSNARLLLLAFSKLLGDAAQAQTAGGAVPDTLTGPGDAVLQALAARYGMHKAREYVIGFDHPLKDYTDHSATFLRELASLDDNKYNMIIYSGLPEAQRSKYFKKPNKGVYQLSKAGIAAVGPYSDKVRSLGGLDLLRLVERMAYAAEIGFEQAGAGAERPAVAALRGLAEADLSDAEVDQLAADFWRALSAEDYLVLSKVQESPAWLLPRYVPWTELAEWFFGSALRAAAVGEDPVVFGDNKDRLGGLLKAILKAAHPRAAAVPPVTPFSPMRCGKDVSSSACAVSSALALSLLVDDTAADHVDWRNGVLGRAPTVAQGLSVPLVDAAVFGGTQWLADTDPVALATGIQTDVVSRD